ncbi:MAG: hypothetical protein WD059_00590 [Balneolaceae bacterium]
MENHFEKHYRTASIFILLFLTSCSLFDNEQIPECLQKEGEQTPDIGGCYNPLYFTRPDWHPEGEWIAAQHADSLDTNEDGEKDTWFVGIWLVHAETGQTQPLLPFGGAPDWNPAGTHLAIHAGGGIYAVEITSLKPARYDTASVTLLTDFNAPAFYPTWSGDGEWIAFDTNYKDKKGANVIWKIKKDGSQLTDISIHQIGEWRFPSWSTSSSKITFGRYVTGGAEGPEIFSMNADGTGAKQLTSNGENYLPKFSPDGNKIIYEHWPEGLSKSIRMMDSDGSNKKVLAKDWSSDMAWSPDGEKIVYVFSNHYYERPGNGQLWIMNADGSNKKQLTNFKSTMP